MQINEIFRSISGESIQAGRPAIFIRTQHCPLRCSYCDTMYALEGNEFTNMTVDEIMEELNQYTTKYVVLTGGEPLIQPDAVDLVRKLITAGYSVEIETSGAVDIKEVSRTSATVTMDWKCPSSGMRDKMLDDNLDELTTRDVLKCVVGSKEDLEEMAEVYRRTRAHVFASPVFGKIDPKEIVEYILDYNLDNIRFQLQLHKFIWPVDKRGV